MERYERECKQLGLLAQRQLNLPKNVVKEKFENMSLVDIFDHLSEEVEELREELFDFRIQTKIDDKQSIHKKIINIKEIDFEKSLGEAGDCAAMLVAVIAKLNRMREEQNDDCA